MIHSTGRALAFFMLMGLPILVVEAGRGQEGEAAPFEIRLPPEIRSEQVQYVYHLMGPFLNYRGRERAEPERNSYLIETSIDHQAADRLQVILYAPGCQIVTFEVRLSPEEERSREIPCEDLPSITFHGRVEMPETLRRQPYDILIRYMPFWQYDFFHLAEGQATEFRLALVTPDEHGAFDVQLPNFSKDAVTESHHRNAWIRFAAFEHGGGGFLCLLTPANVQGGVSRYDLPIQSKYPKEVVFRPRGGVPEGAGSH
jgi:hypothetical protein